MRYFELIRTGHVSGVSSEDELAMFNPILLEGLIVGEINEEQFDEWTLHHKAWTTPISAERYKAENLLAITKI